MSTYHGWHQSNQMACWRLHLILFMATNDVFNRLICQWLNIFCWPPILKFIRDSMGGAVSAHYRCRLIRYGVALPVASLPRWPIRDANAGLELELPLSMAKIIVVSRSRPLENGKLQASRADLTKPRAYFQGDSLLPMSDVLLWFRLFWIHLHLASRLIKLTAISGQATEVTIVNAQSVFSFIIMGTRRIPVALCRWWLAIHAPRLFKLRCFILYVLLLLEGLIKSNENCNVVQLTRFN